MSKLTLGIDIDGVLANFSVGYKNLMEKETPFRFPDISDTFPNTWYWDRAAGVPPEEEKRMWSIIKADPTFWFNLPAYDDVEFFAKFIRSLPREHNVYFITQRAGFAEKWQTEQWLKIHGFLAPTVLISGEKGDLCKALKVTYYIDDKNENVLDVARKSFETKNYQLIRPWNSQQGIGLDIIPRLANLAEFQAEIEKDLS